MVANLVNNTLPEIDIKKDLRDVKIRGFIKSLRKDNTGVGYTLETLLGIKENNHGEPDLVYNSLKIELKTQRKEANSRITLSTKSPIWKPFSDREILNKVGYIDKKNRRGLKVILKIGEYNRKGLKLDLDVKKDRLNIMHKDKGVLCYFVFSDLIKSVENKIYSNLLLVLAETRKEDNEEFFHYVEATLFSDFKEESFKKLLLEGILIWEFRMHLKETGAVRDHGSGLRISRKYLGVLFEKEEKIL